MTIQRAVAACVGKVAFDTWTQAELAAKRRNKNADLRLRPYRCRVCGKVHVGGGEPVRDVRKLERSLSKFHNRKG